MICFLIQGSYATVHLSDYVDGTSPKKMRLACKIFDKEKAPRDFLDKFFPRELEILTKIENPHIIQVHSILQRGPRVFIFMRYADNGDLLDFVKRNGVVPEQQSKLWFRQMASGLHYLHGKNIAHRDLKCENILLSRRFNVKLADFGFARFCADNEGRRVLSQTYCGSAAYAAPEVVSGTPYNPKLADVWSLGIILFIMLNASMPFDDSNLRKLLKDQMSRNWVFRSRVRDTVSALAKGIVRHILEPDITLRLTLERVLSHEWVRARKDKTGSLVGRLVHSAPPIHPQVNKNGVMRLVLHRAESTHTFRDSPIVNSPVVWVSSFFTYCKKFFGLISRSEGIDRRVVNHRRRRVKRKIVRSRKPLMVIKEVSLPVTYVTEKEDKIVTVANSMSKCFLSDEKKLSELSFMPNLISELVFRRCPVPEKLESLIDSIREDAEEVLKLDLKSANCDIIEEQNSLKDNKSSSILFKVKGSLYSLHKFQNISLTK